MLGLLDDVRVVELSHRLAGSFCAKLLADQGAETLKIEPPGRGDPSRYEPPFLGDRPSADNSSLFLAFKNRCAVYEFLQEGTDNFPFRVFRGNTVVVVDN